jgi:tRNA G18 (ribose-2'-O)-methylase SpoU
MRNSPSYDDWVAGRNPVIELLSSERPVDKLLMLSLRSGSLLKIVAMAREKGIPIKDVSREKLDLMFPQINHQGVAAQAAACAYAEPKICWPSRKNAKNRCGGDCRRYEDPTTWVPSSER